MPLRVQAPVFRLLIPFAAGIFLYDNISVEPNHVFWGLFGVFAVAASSQMLPLNWRWKLAGLNGSLFILILPLVGFLYASRRDLRKQFHWIGQQASTKQYYLREIREEPKQTRSGWKITADLIARHDSINSMPITGGIFLYTKDDSLAQQAIPGKKAWILAKLRPIENKTNASFDYARYCRHQKITHQAYLATPDPIQFITPNRENLSSLLHHSRTYIRTTLYQALRDSLHGGLATALFIGWKDGLDPELKQHYTRTGTIHIIAISGLHIALVFEMIWRLLFPLIYLRGGSVLRTTITLLVVWLFCFLAGGEASVLRAGIMFTAVQLGRGLQRPVTGMQALGLSLLTLLIADPDWLFDPGCQLSHGAVAGILLLQPTLSSSRKIQNPLLKNAWESTCLTLAATLGTLPFTAYYFQQFPWLFLPANLIAVPLSSLVLITLFLLIPLYPVPFIGQALAYITQGLLDGMNGWIERLDRIPGTVVSW